MNHTQLLNHLASKHNLKSYLEIGINNPTNNFDKINCELKFGVDPEPTFNKYINVCTSDHYFEKINNGCKLDLIFIDGYHEVSQVKRDFDNSLRCLNDGGFIVIHDTLPDEEITTCVPRGDQKKWHGDVYRFVMTLKKYDGIDFITYNFDEGCTVVWKDRLHHPRKGIIEPNWENYIKHRKELLNITEWQAI